MAARSACRNDPDHFCYICGKYVFKDSRRSIAPLIELRFKDYFKMKLGDQDKPFAPHIKCKNCCDRLSLWSSGKLKRMPFVQFENLVETTRIVVPTLHIKLGIFKNFVKSLDREGQPMKLLKDIFPGLSEAKSQKGVFVGPDRKNNEK